MTDQATRVVPAGWYEDPASTDHVRWWNGIAWTEHTQVKPDIPPVEVDTVGEISGDEISGDGARREDRELDADERAAQTAARIAEARELERQFLSDGSNDDAGTAVYRPSWGNEAGEEAVAPRTATASAWFIALWPLLTLVALAATAYVAIFVSTEPSLEGIPIVYGVPLIPLILTIIWALTDVHRLRRFGNEPASAGFSILGPFVYLIARRTRVRGNGPLVTFILLTLLTAGGIFAAWYTGAAAPVLKAVEIQQTVSGELIASGVATSVSCPIFIESFTPGALYVCDATLPDGSIKPVWVSIDTADGEFSYSLSAR